MSSIRLNPSRASRAACVLAAAVALSALTAPHPARGDDPQPRAKDEANLHDLLEARQEAAQKAYRVRLEQFRAGAGDFGLLVAAEKRLFTAEMELLDKKEARVAACEKNLERCITVKKIVESRFKAGADTKADIDDAEYDRLDAAILLEREKAK